MITVGWGDNDETLMVYRMQIPWTIDDQFRTLDEAFTLIREKECLVDVLVDVRHVSVPSRFESLFYQTWAESRPENLGAVIHIAQKSYARNLQQLWSHLDSHNALDLFVVNTVDCAYALLEDVRRKTSVFA